MASKPPFPPKGSAPKGKAPFPPKDGKKPMPFSKGGKAKKGC